MLFFFLFSYTVKGKEEKESLSNKAPLLPCAIACSEDKHSAH